MSAKDLFYAQKKKESGKAVAVGKPSQPQRPDPQPKTIFLKMSIEISVPGGRTHGNRKNGRKGQKNQPSRQAAHLNLPRQKRSCVGLTPVTKRGHLPQGKKRLSPSTKRKLRAKKGSEGTKPD